MLPQISKQLTANQTTQPPTLPKTSKKTNIKLKDSSYLFHINRHRRSYIWIDEHHPESINQIYTSCLTRLNEIKQKLDDLKEYYKINDKNLIHTMNNLCRHLTRLRLSIGIDQLNSSKTINELIKIIKNNIRNYYDEKRKEHEEQELNREISFDDLNATITKSSNSSINNLDSKQSMHSQTNFDNIEKQIENDLKRCLNFTTTMNFVLKKKQLEYSGRDELLLREDSIISPILLKIKKNLLNIDSNLEQDLVVLIQSHEKTLEAIDHIYKPLIDEIEHITCICDKYLLSFYQTTIGDLIENKSETKTNKTQTYTDLLDTVVKYDKKRGYYVHYINKWLKNLKNMNRLYQDTDSYDGISLLSLSDYSQKLSERFDLDLIQFLLIIPEHDYILMKCYSYLNEWIEYDREYMQLIQNDMCVIDREKRYLTNQKFVCETIYNQLVHRIELLKTSLYDIGLLRRRDFKLFYDYGEENFLDYLMKDKKTNVKFKIEMYKYANLKDCKLVLDKLSKDLSQIESDTIKLNRKFSDEKYDCLKTSLNELKDELYDLYSMKKISQTDIDILETCHFKLKEIYMYKNNTETLKKIYYNLPLPTLKFGLNKSLNDSSISFDLVDENNSFINDFKFQLKMDQFSNSFFIISNMIGKDWIKLYYSLPFYPERGQENIKKDIDEVYLKFKHGSSEREQAYYALLKWQRLNARAKLDDLKLCLDSIGRVDIINELKNELVKESFKRDVKKKSTMLVEDVKKREAELLHQRLKKFFDNKNNQKKSYQFKFQKSM